MGFAAGVFSNKYVASWARWKSRSVVITKTRIETLNQEPIPSAAYLSFMSPPQGYPANTTSI